MIRGADISKCGRYRYCLWRIWDETLPELGFVMLNPSTADAETDDPTIRVCIGRAKRTGYGGIRVVNLFNYRATNPAELKTVDDPIGTFHSPADEVVCMKVIAAWGDHGTLLGLHRARWQEVAEDFCVFYGMGLWALGLTKQGQPRHPLYLSYDIKPFLWIDGSSWPETKC
ncbi:MAG: DUF1643 domain-containing protein [Rhodospirillales bacterium]